MKREDILSVIEESTLEDWVIDWDSGEFRHCEYAIGGVILDPNILTNDERLLAEMKATTTRAVLKATRGTA